MRRMTDDDIEQTLANETVGVLGLPAETAPALRPMSYWFDGEATLYFVYVVGEESRKARLTERADRATFLVYRIDAPFNWRSVRLEGTLERVPEDERAEVEAQMDVSWRPELFERGADSENTDLYRFRIEDREGVLQLQRPFDGRDG